MATILELSDKSLTSFKELLLLGGLSHHENDVSLETWQDEICRLQVWVRNTGAYEVGQSSLEYRLRNSPLLYHQIVKLFERIQDLLTYLKEILDEDIGDGVYDEEHGKSLEESEDDIGDGAGIQHIHKSLREIISYLNRMTTAILRVPYDAEVVGTDKLQAPATSNTSSLASNLLVLTKIALQASQSLYNIISTQESDRTSWELRERLAALNNTLKGLQEIDFEHETTIISLKLPLCHCAKVCREFEGIIHSDQKHSPGWAEPNQKQIDLQNLKIALSEYEATISIALGLIALQKTKATPTVIDEYRKMVTETKSDLYNHLARLEDSLGAKKVSTVQALAIDPLSQGKMIEERNCIQQCIYICSRAHTYIDGIESRHQDIFTGNIDEYGLGATVVSNAVQRETLVHEKRRLSADLRSLESQTVSQLHDLNNQITSLSEQKLQVSNEDKKQLEKIKEERDMLTRWLSVTAEARGAQTNDAFKDIMSENESQHSIVTTLGDLISAKRISSGPRASRLLGGPISESSLQRVSHDFEINMLDNVGFQH